MARLAQAEQSPFPDTTPRVWDPLPVAFRRSLRRYLAARVSSSAIDHEGSIERETLQGLADLGAFGVNLPGRWGGSELGLAGACDTVDEIARVDRSVATTVGLHLGLGSRPLVAYGSDAQKDRWLRPMAAGEAVSAFATTEPAAGSDLSHLATRGSLEGNRLRIDGRKIFVTNGGIADLFTITASTPGLGGAERGQSLVLLERGDPGIEVGAEEKKMGLRGSSTVPVFFDGVMLDQDRVLGEAGTGGRQLLHVLSFGRTIMSAGCVGTARAALAATNAHVSARRQFGRALLDLPVVRRQVAEMSARLFAMEALVAETAALEDDHAALERLSLSTKVFCSDGDWDICDRALQLHGGSGSLEETGVDMLLRDARITRIFEGANDVLLGRIGAAELLAPRPVIPGVTAAARLALYCDELRAESYAARGLGALRDGVLLHRIGRTAVARDAQWAAERRALALDTAAARARAHIHGELALADAERALCEAAWAPIGDIVEAALPGEHA